jgi:hypothetical protein
LEGLWQEKALRKSYRGVGQKCVGARGTAAAVMIVYLFIFEDLTLDVRPELAQQTSCPP